VSLWGWLNQSVTEMLWRPCEDHVLHVCQFPKPGSPLSISMSLYAVSVCMHVSWGERGLTYCHHYQWTPSQWGAGGGRAGTQPS
jgi:hypothetical protein